jgi:hypothetical protein
VASTADLDGGADALVGVLGGMQPQSLGEFVLELGHPQLTAQFDELVAVGWATGLPVDPRRFACFIQPRRQLSLMPRVLGDAETVAGWRALR